MIDQLEALRFSSARLRNIVKRIAPQELTEPAYPTEWTIADTLSHLGSGAVIFKRRLEDTLDGKVDDPQFNQSVWDEWNAKPPVAQALDCLIADAALLDSLDAVSEDQRTKFNRPLGPLNIDFAGFVGLRLGEHALHSWDVEVALTPASILPPEVAEVLIDELGTVAKFFGKPTGIEHVVTVRTTEPVRGFKIALTADSLEFSPSDPTESPDLELPAEAFIRLVYGRLDPKHTPTVSSEALVEELRKAFPGF